MRTVDAPEAQARLDEIIEDAQRQPILIRRQDQAIAVVVSIRDNERLRALNVQAFSRCERKSRKKLRLPDSPRRRWPT
jgi:hypothetical protein